MTTARTFVWFIHLSAPLYIARTVRRYAQPRICLHNSSNLLSLCLFESIRSISQLQMLFLSTEIALLVFNILSIDYLNASDISLAFRAIQFGGMYAHLWMPVEKLKYLRSIWQVRQRRQFFPVHLSLQLLIFFSPADWLPISFPWCSQFTIAYAASVVCFIPYCGAFTAPIVLSVPTPLIRWAAREFISIFVFEFHFFLCSGWYLS